VTIFARIPALLPPVARRNPAVRAYTLKIHTPGDCKEAWIKEVEAEALARMGLVGG